MDGFNETEAQSEAAPAWHKLVLPGLLALLVFGCYFTRLTDLTLRGEESRRAQVAAEMLRTGDWIVPRQQGELYLSRPPLGSYPIAVMAMATGELSPFAVRFPSVIAILLTTLLLYCYARHFLSPLGAFAAGCSFATAVQVMEIGRLGESEALFTLLAGSSLLLWHLGYVRHWPAAWTWIVGYGLAALAGLDKGPQGPVYFMAVSWTWLAMRRDWKYLFSGGHLAGVVGFLMVLGSWQVPYLLATNWECSLKIWMYNAADRYQTHSVLGLFGHVLLFPVQVVSCLLPWSVMLGLLFKKKFRRTLGHLRPLVKFHLVALAVTFPTVWFAVSANTRYFMPLYPCLALLMGIVTQRLAEWQPEASWKKWWPCCQWASIAGMLIVASAMLFSTLAPWLREASTTLHLLTAMEFMVISLVLAGTVLWSMRSQHPWRMYASVFSLAVFMALTYNVVVVSALVKSANHAEQQVAALKQKLPPDARLVSLNQVHHLFAYLYRKPIPVVPWDKQARQLPDGVEYFCFEKRRDQTVDLPFAWEPVAVISCDRNKRNPPQVSVVVARRQASVARQRTEEIR